jgi:hypothetical protein
MDGRTALPDCPDGGRRAERGVLGTEFRGGESSGFSRVETCRPLFADVSVADGQHLSEPEVKAPSPLKRPDTVSGRCCVIFGHAEVADSDVGSTGE